MSAPSPPDDGGKGSIHVRSTREADAEALEALQVRVFPTLDDAQRFRRHHYLRHLELFPEGQFVAVARSLRAGRLVGMTSTLRLDFDFENPQHRFEDIAQGGFLTAHRASGSWLYGADIGVDPDYRRRGIARRLYTMRHGIVRRLSLEGQVTVGMLRGFGRLKDRMTAPQYYERVV